MFFFSVMNFLVGDGGQGQSGNHYKGQQEVQEDDKEREEGHSRHIGVPNEFSKFLRQLLRRLALAFP